MVNKFEIGEKVRIVDDGQSYDTYIEMAHILGSEKYKESYNRLDYKNHIYNDKIVTVLNFAFHTTAPDGPVIYLVHLEETDEELLIGEAGLESLDFKELLIETRRKYAN